MSTKQHPVIAAIQMCSVDNIDENLKTASDLIAIAAKAGAKLVVLPEMFAVMNNDIKVQMKEPFGHGKIQDFLAKVANQNRVWVVGGTIPIACDHSQKFAAACLVFDDHGKFIARYDKIHMFDVKISANEIYEESALINPGKEIVVVKTPIGNVGLAVCYDVRFPDQFKKLVVSGAEIIALPSAFTMKTGSAHWEILMKCRAIDTFCYMVGACQGGLHQNGRQTYGNSMIVEPWGSIVARKSDDGSGVIYASIDLDKVYEARKTIPIMNFS